jgi:hypothetical protein
MPCLETRQSMSSTSLEQTLRIKHERRAYAVQ